MTDLQAYNRFLRAFQTAEAMLGRRPHTIWMNDALYKRVKLLPKGMYGQGRFWYCDVRIDNSLENDQLYFL